MHFTRFGLSPALVIIIKVLSLYCYSVSRQLQFLGTAVSVIRGERLGKKTSFEGKPGRVVVGEMADHGGR